MANRFSKKTAVLLSSACASLAVLGGVGVEAVAKTQQRAGAEDGTTLTLTLASGQLGDTASDGSSWTTQTAAVNTANGNPITFEHYGAYVSSSYSYVAGISAWGYIANITAITGIQSVNVTYSSSGGTGKIYCVYGWYDGTPSSASDIEWEASSSELSAIHDAGGTDHLVTSGADYSVSGYGPSYLMFYCFGEYTTISSITYNYTCQPTTAMTAPLTVTVNNPLVTSGDTTVSLNDGVKIFAWMKAGTNFEANPAEFTPNDDGTWTYSIDSVTYDDITSTDAFQINLTLGIDSIDWSYQLGTSSVSILPGQTRLTIESPTFASQPATEGHTVTINCSVSFSTANTWVSGISILYSTVSSFSAPVYEENWPSDVSIHGQSSECPSYSNVSVTLPAKVSGTLYVALYAYMEWAPTSSNKGHAIAANADGSALAFEITSDATITLNMTFGTSNLDETYTYNNGTCYYGVYSMTSSSIEYTTTEDTPEATAVTTTDLNTTVYAGTNQEGVTPNVSFEGGAEEYTLSVDDPSLDNVNLRIEGQKIVPLKGGTTTSVTLTTVRSKLTSTFDVVIENSTYDKNYSELYASDNDDWAYAWENSDQEDWFDVNEAITSSSISEISGLSSNFANGMDISSVKALYENGAKYFDFDGTERSLFYLLKDGGVNWVRLRLWVRPSETDGATFYDYGGGSCDLDRVTWMAHETRAAGLNLLLDFHYSDYWTHPGQQVVPKDWTNLSQSELTEKVRSYTKETLVHLYENDALPHMVQLGNETTSGMMMLKAPSYDTSSTMQMYSVSGSTKWGNPIYASTSTSANYPGSTGANGGMVTYVGAGSNGVDDAISEINSTYGSTAVYDDIGDTDIKKMVHYTSTLDQDDYPNRWSDSNNITRVRNFAYYFASAGVDFDVVGLSAYPFYDFDTDTMRFNQTTTDTANSLTPSAFYNGLVSIQNTFQNSTNNQYLGDKEIMIAETSTPFTQYGWNDFTASQKNASCAAYGVSILEQAKFIHDMTEACSKVSSCTGVFYWEPAWIPIGTVDTEANTATCAVPWGAPGTKASWANQALFSFGGKALGSLKVYSLMNPNV